MPLPFDEKYIAQLPALKLLIHMGWQYLSPEEALQARGDNSSQVLFKSILKQQLQAINTIEHKGKRYTFSEENIQKAIRALHNLPIEEGYIKANEAYYELITLGKSFEQTIANDKKSFSLRYIDWEHPENNTYHVTEEFSVRRTGRKQHYRPDIVLLINGIPMVMIECKSPEIKGAVHKGIEQHMRNQQQDGIRSLYQYTHLLISLAATHKPKYATTGTEKEFWSLWKERFKTKATHDAWQQRLQSLKQSPLSTTTPSFQERYKNVWTHLNHTIDQQEITTAQDNILYSLCQPQRLLDLMANFILYEHGTKKIARYPQYFATRYTLNKIAQQDSNGLRQGGVIWHTQGSGKSLTMVMLAKLITKHPHIHNPKIILVTDRIDLDDQITDTFKKCQIAISNPTTAKQLTDLLTRTTDEVITTTVHKFEAVVKHLQQPIDSPNIFILVDEGHRTQYGSFNVAMQQVFPKGCFIAFTGTPLMKKEKHTAKRFGGIIDVYAITDAIKDRAVVPIFYEGRHHLIEVNEKPLDNYFERVAEPLTPYGKAALKKKSSSTHQLNQAEQIIYARAWDIANHYQKNVQGIRFGSLQAKGQLVAPNKATAIKYRKNIHEITQKKVSCEVLISPPDTREGYDDAFEHHNDEVKVFWEEMIDKYGNAKTYEKSLISSFKNNDHPEIIIVVDKLLTGFDAPNNYVLYLTRKMKDHALLQAIARVNRLAPGKENGLIIDYYGNLENLDAALATYGGAHNYDAADLQGTVTNISQEIKKLPQTHAELWDIFKTIKRKYNEPAYEKLLRDEALRHIFYKKLSSFARLLKLALSTLAFADNTSDQQIDKYKHDAKFFLKLRASVKRRYFDSLDYKQYEPQVQKLIDQHITTDGETLRITELVDIFDKKARDKEVEKLTSKAAKADHIASRTLKAINIKIDEDPAYFKKLSRLIKDTIEAYHQLRMSEAAYLDKVKQYEHQCHSQEQHNLPHSLVDKHMATALYNSVNDLFDQQLKNTDEGTRASIALGVEREMKAIILEDGKPLIDWADKSHIEKKIRQAIDNYFYELGIAQGIELPHDRIDKFVNEALTIAKRHHE